MRLNRTFLVGRKARDIIHKAHLDEMARQASLTPEERVAEDQQREQDIGNINALAKARRDSLVIRAEATGPIGPGSN